MNNLVIIEILHLETGNRWWQVIENDDHAFPILAIFTTKEEAEDFVKGKINKYPLPDTPSITYNT